MPQEQFPRVQKKIQIPQLQLAQEEMRTKMAHTTLEKTFEERATLNQSVVRIVNGTARAWSIQCQILEIISPASIKQAMEMQAEADYRKHEEILQSEGEQQTETSPARGKQQDCDSVEQQSSAQDPGACSQPKQKLTRHHRSLRCHEQGLVQQSEDPIE